MSSDKRGPGRNTAKRVLSCLAVLLGLLALTACETSLPKPVMVRAVKAIHVPHLLATDAYPHGHDALQLYRPALR
ncbi:hypothetical protein ACIQVN_12150 [Streptomyces cyaneofuscatus]|uniref:hypothetical protein n=1 Tax=Streptomyces cyaneofuscatus TaxID=66883 RepID=UPI00381DDDC5